MTDHRLFIAVFATMLPCIGQTVDLNNYKSCKPCHAEIYNEWETTRHNRAWTSEDFKSLSKDYSKQDCLNCHAPKPFFETGLKKEPVLRDDDRTGGINCLTCHRKEHAVMAVYNDSKGDCNPLFTDQLTAANICANCHLLAAEEWKKSSYSQPGKNYSTCIDCHMKTVKRASAKGGKIRSVHQHITYGEHDTKALEYATLHLGAKIEGGKVTVTLKNDNVGHNLPSGRIGRTLVLITAVKNADDEVVNMQKEYFTKYDNKTKPDQSIPPDKVVSYTYDTKAESGEVVVRVLYKTDPDMTDNKALKVTEQKFSF
ncbi:MAG: multiheme c-type cytochrome [Chitinivibrionales bacterium]|nr:multiheme c-type cytochrome [Chitinivibrionales bacterium]